MNGYHKGKPLSSEKQQRENKEGARQQQKERLGKDTPCLNTTQKGLRRSRGGTEGREWDSPVCGANRTDHWIQQLARKLILCRGKFS